MSRAKMGNLTPIESRDLQRMQDPSSSCALSDDLARKEDLQQMHRGVLAQIEREEETRCSAPDAYRLSLMSDAAVTGVYRRGKDYMSSADLLRYAREARSAHLAQVDLSQNTGVDECPCKNEQSDTMMRHKRVSFPLWSSRSKACPNGYEREFRFGLTQERRILQRTRAAFRSRRLRRFW